MPTMSRIETFEDVKTSILKHYPALKPEFYREGDRKIIEEFDEKNYKYDPKSPHRLTDLPEKFAAQLKQLEGAVAYIRPLREVISLIFMIQAPCCG